VLPANNPLPAVNPDETVKLTAAFVVAPVPKVGTAEQA
jgi:hypothetical protein